MKSFLWYQALVKPSWAPPSYIFGPVWTFLYVIIAVSFGKAFLMFFKGEVSFYVVLPFALNLVFNFLFTPIQFGLKNNALAFVDIVLVFGTLIWSMLSIYPYAKWIALVNIPYLLWVSFATVLQLTITLKN